MKADIGTDVFLPGRVLVAVGEGVVGESGAKEVVEGGVEGVEDVK